MENEELAIIIANAAEEKKGLDTEVLNVIGVTDMTDYIIITEGASSAQLKAIANHIETTVSSHGLEPHHKEGRYGDKWFLLDYNGVVVHIIESEARQFYNLEEFWGKAFFLPQDQWQK